LKGAAAPPGAVKPPRVAPLKVITLNIHKGFTAFNRAFTLKKLKTALKESGADVVFLQEVVGRHDERAAEVAEWPTQPQFEYLADTVWPHFAYGRNALYPSGHHGNAILSRYPITSHRSENLSTNRFEARGLLHCTVSSPDLPRPLHLVNVHLGLTERGRQTQAAAVTRHVAAHVPEEAPLIVAGDFNDWRRRLSKRLKGELGLTEAHEAIHGAPALTYPVVRPLVAVDRIYFRRLSLRDARALAGAQWRELSDHAAVAADFEPAATS